MLVFPDLKCMFSTICKVGTNSLYNYWGSVMYGEEDPMLKKLRDGEEIGVDTWLVRHNIRKRIKKDFEVHWGPQGLWRVRQGLVQEPIADYYKFAFVRNPWVRTVSAFRELIRRYPFGQAKADEAAGLTYYEIHDLMNGHVSFENFINFIVNIERDHTDIINGHWRTQIITLNMHHEVGKLEYDFLGKLENANEDMSRAQKHLGLEETKLAKEHVTATYDYKLYYTNSKTIDMLGEYYKEDIETFGYDFS